MRAEQGYFSRIRTGQRFTSPSDDRVTLPDMIKAIQITGAGLIEWAPKIQANETVEINWEDTPHNVPKTIIPHQVINHATEHRSQVMSIMTQIGVAPPDVSSWSYFNELEN